MNKFLAKTCLLLSVMLAPFTARAQLMEGMSAIIQAGQMAGLVWVPHVSNPCHYVEYWYLGPEYIYPNSPGTGQDIDTLIRPLTGATDFSTNSAFFQYAKSQLPGGKRLVVSTIELEHCGPNLP